MNTELLQFAMHLTGHGEEDIEQMYNDWINSPSTPSFAPEQQKPSVEEKEESFQAFKQKFMAACKEQSPTNQK